MKSKFDIYWGWIKTFFVVFIIQRIERIIVALTVKRLYGPKSVDYDLNELIVLSLVRDGELYIKSFIEHYFSLGVKHIVFLDNGSTDETIAIAKSYENLTVLSAKLPFKYFKMAMRNYLVYRYGKKRWSLYVDIDELFDYPFSSQIKLCDFLSYLNSKSYTAVATQMLDMFSENPLNQVKSRKDDSLKVKYKYYDISGIHKLEYHLRKNIINKNIKLHYGGIRKQIFGTDFVSGTILTKHPLIFLDGKVLPLFRDEHGVRYARVADVTCVLLHYKFLGNFYENTRRIAHEQSYGYNSIEYKRYFNVISMTPDLNLKLDTAQELVSVNDLIENQFLVVSEDYQDWVASHRN